MTSALPQRPAFDSTLSRELFEHIVTHMQDLTPREQFTIKHITQGHGEVYSAGPVFKALLEDNPDLMDRTIDAADSTLSFHTAMAPSLLVWALNQNWTEQGFYHDTMMAKWLSRCLDSRSTQGTIVAASQFMAQLLPLVPEIPEAGRARFLAVTMEELYRYATPWKNPAPTESSTRYLALSHELTQLCGKEKSSTGHAFSELWRSKAALTLSELSAGKSRSDLATWLATSSLPLNDRQEVLGWGSADTWAIPCVASLLLPALPNTERERLSALPFVTHGGNAPDAPTLNRALFQLYCPDMYPLMELAMPDGDWYTRETIESWVTRLDTVESDTFPLPADLPENNMPN